jgi:hypothetical protein
MALGKVANENGLIFKIWEHIFKQINAKLCFSINCRDRTVYFHALASTKEFSVSNTVLKNETFATSPDAYYAFNLLGDRGEKSQSTAEVYDEKTNVIFYTQINRDGIGCWVSCFGKFQKKWKNNSFVFHRMLKRNLALKQTG